MMARTYLILLGQAFLTLWTCWADDGPSVRIDNLLHVNWNLTVGLFKTDQRLVESFLARRFEDEDNGKSDFLIRQNEKDIQLLYSIINSIIWASACSPSKSNI